MHSMGLPATVVRSWVCWPALYNCPKQMYLIVAWPTRESVSLTRALILAGMLPEEGPWTAGYLHLWHSKR